MKKTRPPSAAERASPAEGLARKERGPVPAAATQRPATATPAAEGGLWEALTLMRSSQGAPLEPDVAQRFAQRLGAPLADVQVHTDEAAQAAARVLDAEAVTLGRDVYFAPGRYSPGTSAGDALLAHELTHVVQAARAPASPGYRLSSPGDAQEQEATRNEALASAPPAAAAAAASSVSGAVHADGGGTVYRFIFPLVERAIAAYLIYNEYAEDQHEAEVARSKDEVVELRGKPRFEVSAAHTEYIDRVTHRGNPADVRFRYGDLASGAIPIFRDGKGLFQSMRPVEVPLRLLGLGTETSDTEPKLVVQVLDGVVEGIFGAVPAGTAGWREVARNVYQEGASRLARRWLGVQDVVMPNAAPELKDGKLGFHQGFDFKLNGAFGAKGQLDVSDGNVSFVADANIQVPGLTRTDFHIQKDPGGGLSGNAQIAFTFRGFDGRVRATFARGVLDIRGTVTYAHPDGFSGSLTVLVTDARSAWAAVDGQIAQWGPIASPRTDLPARGGAGQGTGAAKGTPVPRASAGAGQQTAPAATGPERQTEGYVLAGWGVVDFRYKDWLSGRAQVIVDPAGDITSLGRVEIPRTFELMREHRWRRLLLDRSVRTPNYPVWGLAAVYAAGRVMVEGEVYIGPLIFRDGFAEGVFSTRPGFENALRIGGTLQIFGGGALDLDITAKVAAGARVPGTPDEWTFELASVTVPVHAEAALDADASVTAAIERRARPKGGGADYILEGTFDLSAALTFRLEGRAELNFRSYGLKKWKFGPYFWLLGKASFSWPFRHFKLGDDPAPNPAKQLSGESSLRTMLSDLLRDRPKAAGPVKKAEADWKERGKAQEVKPQAEAENVSVPAAPELGDVNAPPLGPPQPAPSTSDAPPAPPPDPNAPPPSDAGVPVAGVPEAPPPEPAPVPEPLPAGTDVPFSMEGEPHHLILKPGHPPALIMASAPGRLALKLRRTRDPIDAQIRQSLSPVPLLVQQRDTLDELIIEADAIEQRARDLGYEDRIPPSVPGLKDLAQRLARVARQFGWKDLEGFIPASPKPSPDLPPQAEEILALPFEEFIAHCDSLPPQRALPLLRNQKEFYEKEHADLSRFISGRSHDDLWEQADTRRKLLVTRIQLLVAKIRQASDKVNPGERAKLPCFSPETPVLTPSGPRPIGSLQVGDAIYCAPAHARGEPTVGFVEDVHRNLTLRFFHVRAGGSTVRATGRHPFWVEEQGDFVAAEALQVGMHLRRLAGSPVRIDSLEVEQLEVAAAAPTVDVSVSPHSTYFVGTGLFVHNAPAIPARQTLTFLQSDGTVVPTGAYKIYLGVNPDPEFAKSSYVGQTFQTREARLNAHRAEARAWLDKNPGVADSDEKKRYYRFKLTMETHVIVDGLLNGDQADWVEQLNIEKERNLKNEVMNRREELKSTAAAVKARIEADPLVVASGYCP